MKEIVGGGILRLPQIFSQQKCKQEYFYWSPKTKKTECLAKGSLESMTEMPLQKNSWFISYHIFPQSLKSSSNFSSSLNWLKASDFAKLSDRTQVSICGDSHLTSENDADRVKSR